MPSTSVQFSSGNLTLEGVLHQPDSGPSSRVVVVAHPHPQRGGSMDNNVVAIVVRALLEAGVAALRFNFRGAGRSEGVFDNGDGEQEDIKAALAHARQLEGIESVGLAGYSFGAGMAARVADASIPRLALVALPTRGLEAVSLAAFANPLLLVSGTNDQISSAEAIQTWARDRANVTAIGVSGADHFWWGKEQELSEAIGTFFAPSWG